MLDVDAEDRVDDQPIAGGIRFPRTGQYHIKQEARVRGGVGYVDSVPMLACARRRPCCWLAAGIPREFSNAPHPHPWLAGFLRRGAPRLL